MGFNYKKSLTLSSFQIVEHPFARPQQKEGYRKVFIS